MRKQRPDRPKQDEARRHHYEAVDSDGEQIPMLIDANESEEEYGAISDVSEDESDEEDTTTLKTLTEKWSKKDAMKKDEGEEARGGTKPSRQLRHKTSQDEAAHQSPFSDEARLEAGESTKESDVKGEGR